MAADELDDEERALLDQHRAKKKKTAEADKEVWIRQGDNEAAVPYSKARNWLQKTFGIDLDDEPTQDQPDAAPGQPEGGQQSAAVRRFAGRRDAG
jgi:hypothetical protein